MANLMKGNFTPKHEVKSDDSKESLEEKFEREVQKHLGGSIAYVAKRKVLWDVPDNDEQEKK